MLELQHISYDVEQDGGSREILHDIDLTINERFVAITGPNGGGKSTMAKVIAGEQLTKLMILGLTEKEAEEQIVNGFLK